MGIDSPCVHYSKRSKRGHAAFLPTTTITAHSQWLRRAGVGP